MCVFLTWFPMFLQDVVEFPLLVFVKLLISRVPPAQSEVVVSKTAPPPPPPMSAVSLSSAPVSVSPQLATEGFARIAARTGLSFAFAFLRRAWQTQEDGGLCEQVSFPHYIIITSSLHHLLQCFILLRIYGYIMHASHHNI